VFSCNKRVITCRNFIRGRLILVTWQSYTRSGHTYIEVETSNSAAKNCNRGKVSYLYFTVTRFEELLRSPNRMREKVTTYFVQYFSNNKSNDTGKDTIGTKTFKQDRKFTYNVKNVFGHNICFDFLYKFCLQRFSL
jgi:hypothetical protein